MYAYVHIYICIYIYIIRRDRGQVGRFGDCFLFRIRTRHVVAVVDPFGNDFWGDRGREGFYRERILIYKRAGNEV